MPFNPRSAAHSSHFIQGIALTTGAIEWTTLPAELTLATRMLVDAGEFDSAIFEAFKLVEATIQSRVRSRNVGRTLVDEALGGTPPNIKIGSEADYQPVHQMFAGALGFIRNDRGHKREPAVPCRSAGACRWYLGHAALLLHLLSRDRALQAKVTATSVHGSPQHGRIQYHGLNLDNAPEVRVAGQAVPMVGRSNTLLEASLPGSFIGEVQLYSDGELVDERYCDARAVDGTYEGVYEVVDVDLPLLADRDGRTLHAGYVGMLLKIWQSGAEYTQLFPTVAGKYRKGEFVNWRWDTTIAVGEAWYRTADSPIVRYGWTSSALLASDVIAPRSALKLGAVVALPASISLEPGTALTLRARGIESVAGARREVDLTREATWKSLDERIAYADASIVRAKQLGRTTIRAVASGFQSEVHISVEHRTRGRKRTYFQGLRLVQQIAFDANDDLYITNQSDRIYRLKRGGGLEVALQASRADDLGYRIDCIAVTPSRGIYFTAPSPRRILYFAHLSTGYAPGELLGPDDGLTKKSVALDPAGNIIVGVMGPRPGMGSVLTIRPDGSSSYFDARDSAHNLSVGLDSRIYVATPQFGTVDVFDTDGRLRESVSYGSPGSVGGIFVASDLSIYVAMFNGGHVLRISNDARRSITTVAEEVGNPCGLAVDAGGSLYVADFSTGSIYVID